MIKKITDFRFKYLTMDPSVDPKNKQSRQDWILFMANKTKKFPVRQVYNRLIPTVSKMTVNTDLKTLEEQGLIKREKESDGTSHIIPLFKDSGEAPEPKHIKYKRIFLDIGLPILALTMLLIFVIIQI